MELKRIDKAFYQQLGSELHEARIKCGYSLRYLGMLTGVSRVTLDNYEMGTARIRPDVFEDICKALQINPTLKVEVTIGEKTFKN